MESSATSQGNKRPVGYKGILTCFIYSSLILKDRVVLLVQVEFSLPPLSMIAHNYPSFIGYLTDFFYFIFIFFSENQPRLIYNCMSLICQSQASPARKL